MAEMKHESRLTIDVIRSTEAFAALGDEWRQFEQKTGWPYLTASYDWLYTYWDVFQHREDHKFGFNKQLCILVARAGEEIQAIAPFVRLERRKYGVVFRFVEFLGQTWGATFLDIIGQGVPAQVLKAMMDTLYQQEQFDCLHLRYIPASSPNFALQDKGAYLLDACPYIPVGSYSDFVHYQQVQYTRKFRQNMRRLKRKIEKDGHAWEIVLDKTEDVHFADIERISRQKLEDSKHSLYMDEDKRKFVKRVASKLNASTLFLKIDGQAAAYRLIFYFNGHKFNFDTSYDRRYRDYGLGLLNSEANIEDSFEQQVQRHYLGIGLSRHKFYFTPHYETLYTWLQPGNTWTAKGKTAVLAALNRRIEQRVREKMAQFRHLTAK